MEAGRDGRSGAWAGGLRLGLPAGSLGAFVPFHLHSATPEFCRRCVPSSRLPTIAFLLGACTETPQTSTPAPPPKPTGPVAGSPTTPSGKARIALLLPLSGRSAAIGQSMQQAAELALFDTGAKELALAAYDAGESGDAAVQAYTQGAQADGCALILGPLFGASATALAPLRRTGGTNIIAFSNDESVAQPGLWVMGIAAPPQVRRVVDYTVSTGIKRFAVLSPRSTYGEQMARTLESHVAVRGGTVVATETYDEGSDISIAAKRLADATKGEGKLAILLPIAPPRLQHRAGLAQRQRRRHQVGAADRHRRVGHAGHRLGSDAARRLVRRARSGAARRLRAQASSRPTAARRSGWRRSPMTPSRSPPSWRG